LSSRTKKRPQIAPPTPERRTRCAQVAAARQKGLVVVLEDIHDPHNAEAALRNCDAFGVQNVHFVFRDESPFDPRRVGKSSSSSANKWLDFTVHHSTNACISSLRSTKHVLAAAVSEPDAIAVADAELGHTNLAIWFGNENRGLSSQAIDAADFLITVPLTGMVQSINVSVAVSIILYQTTQHRQGAEYLLGAQAREALVGNFLKR
jgi:tRNA (guanosine-2'-O-)-methyltransferase